MIPAIGNNDPKWHNEFAQDEAEDYYTFLFNLWFKNHRANSNVANLTDIESTFLTGGYYRFIVEDYVFFAMNSLYFYKETENMDHHGIDQA